MRRKGERQEREDWIPVYTGMTEKLRTWIPDSADKSGMTSMRNRSAVLANGCYNTDRTVCTGRMVKRKLDSRFRGNDREVKNLDSHFHGNDRGKRDASQYIIN